MQRSSRGPQAGKHSEYQSSWQHTTVIGGPLVASLRLASGVPASSHYGTATTLTPRRRGRPVSFLYGVPALCTINAMFARPKK